MRTYRAFILVSIVLVEANVIPNDESTTHGGPPENDETSEDSWHGTTTALPVNSLSSTAASSVVTNSESAAITSEKNESAVKDLLIQPEGAAAGDQQENYEPELGKDIEYRYSDYQHVPEEYSKNFEERQLDLGGHEASTAVGAVTEDDVYDGSGNGVIHYGEFLDDMDQTGMQTTPKIPRTICGETSIGRCFSGDTSQKVNSFVSFVQKYLWETPLNLLHSTFFSALRLLVSSLPLVNRLMPVVDALEGMNVAYLIARLPEVVLSLGTALPQVLREYIRDIILTNPNIPLPNLLINIFRRLLGADGEE